MKEIQRFVYDGSMHNAAHAKESAKNSEMHLKNNHMGHEHRHFILVETVNRG